MCLSLQSCFNKITKFVTISLNEWWNHYIQHFGEEFTIILLLPLWAPLYVIVPAAPHPRNTLANSQNFSREMSTTLWVLPSWGQSDWRTAESCHSFSKFLTTFMFSSFPHQRISWQILLKIFHLLQVIQWCPANQIKYPPVCHSPQVQLCHWQQVLQWLQNWRFRMISSRPVPPRTWSRTFLRQLVSR